MNQVNDRVVLKCKDNFIEYKRRMISEFSINFPDLASCLRNIRPNIELADLPEGPANRPDPGEIPGTPAHNAPQPVQNASDAEFKRWSIRYEQYRQFDKMRTSACGFIDLSIEGEAKDRLCSHESYQDAINDKNFRKLWKIVLELYSPQGAAKQKAIIDAKVALFSIKMGEKESIAEYFSRFKRLKDEIIELGVTVAEGQACAALVFGLNNDFETFQQSFSQLDDDVIKDITAVKEMIDKIPRRSMNQTSAKQINKINLISSTGATSSLSNWDVKPVRALHATSSKSWNDFTDKEKMESIIQKQAKKKEMICFNCKEKGHPFSKCPKLSKNIP